MTLEATVDEYLSGLELEWRRVAAGEWGLTVEAAGWPLHLGLALRDGLLRAQGEVVGPDQLSSHELLYRNRGLVLVRYAETGAGRGVGPRRAAARARHAHVARPFPRAPARRGDRRAPARSGRERERLSAQAADSTRRTNAVFAAV
jgi:hypothetical protein